MCEKEPKRRSCTECPQYDGMKCTATDFTLGDRDEVLHQEHRRGFICLDTGEAELKGDAVLQWTAEQERLSQEKGYKSCNEMWDAEGKQVKCGFLIDEDNKQLEPVLQISNDPGPVKLTFQYEENAESVDDTMYHPNSTTADCIADMLHKEEGGPFTSVFTAGSPSSEGPSRRDGPPQKGKIDENKAVHSSQCLPVTLSSDDTCYNCKKSHTEGDRLVCNRWGLQDILMPYRPCEKWALDPNKIKRQNEANAGDLVIVPGSSICTADDVSISKRPAEDNCITYVSNTPESNAVLTDEEISQLKDAMYTMQRILEQHGVTL